MSQRLPYDQYAEMLWKNGQGTTREVYRYPATEQYDWRISIATIPVDGPFSRFPGYLRNISVLEGEGMQLTINGKQGSFIPPFQATDFNGDSDISCKISGGPLLDFNIIYNATTIQVCVQWTNGSQLTHHEGILLLFNAGGSLDVMVDAESHRLQHYDSLLIDAPATVTVDHCTENRFACVILTAVNSEVS